MQPIGASEPPKSRFQELRRRIGWTTGEAARKLGVREDVARAWDIARRNAPPPVLDGMAELADAVESAVRAMAPAAKRPRGRRHPAGTKPS